MPGPLAVITDAGNVFGANVKVGPDSGVIDPVFQFTGAKIGFDVKDRFMVPLSVDLNRILTVTTNDGNTFGADILPGNELKPVPPFQFTGAKIGNNVQDRFMVALGNTLVVIKNDGSVFGADVTGQNIGNVSQFTGAKIGNNVQDRFMVALGNTLVVIKDDGSVFGADVTGPSIGPVSQFTGAKIGFNVQDRFMVALGNTLVVIKDDGSVFGAGADVSGRRSVTYSSSPGQRSASTPRTGSWWRWAKHSAPHAGLAGVR